MIPEIGGVVFGDTVDPNDSVVCSVIQSDFQINHFCTLFHNKVLARKNTNAVQSRSRLVCANRVLWFSETLSFFLSFEVLLSIFLHILKIRLFPQKQLTIFVTCFNLAVT